MKITHAQLKQIIKEELSQIVKEQEEKNLFQKLFTKESALTPYEFNYDEWLKLSNDEKLKAVRMMRNVFKQDMQLAHDISWSRDLISSTQDEQGIVQQLDGLSTYEKEPW